MPVARVAARALVLFSASSLALACSGGDSGPDAAYPHECGPVRADAGAANTLVETVVAATTLKKSCSPYHVDQPVSVNADLTIEPGVQIVACQGGCRSRITVARSGRLLAVGTSDEPIVFTSQYAESGGAIGGQWTGLLFLESQPGSRLEHVVIEFAGGPYTGQPSDDEFSRYEFPVEGSLLCDSTPDLVVNDVWIRRSRGYAAAASTSAEFDSAGKNLYAGFDRVTLTDNAKAMWIPVDHGGTLGPDICFAARDQAGACPAAVVAPAGNFVELHVDDRLGRAPDDITRDAVWKAYAAPFLVENINVTHGALLTVADGVELRMTDVGGITVGLNDPGALRMVASAPGGIRVTSAYGSPQPRQHWNGLYLWANTDDARTRVENVDLGYGGRRSPSSAQAPASIIAVYDANPTVIGNRVHHSLGAGIHWNCTSEPPGLEEPPLPSTNSGDDATIACADAIGSSVAEDYGCGCMITGCADRCPVPGPF